MHNRDYLILLILFCLTSSIYSQQQKTNPFSCENFSVAILGNTTLCIDQDTALLSAEIKGGHPPYKYLWNDGSIYSEAKISISDDVYPNVIIQDNLGCKTRKSVQLKRITSTSQKISPKTPTLCPNGFVMLNSFHKSDSYEWVNINNPTEVVSREREYKVGKPGIYRLNTSLTKGENTCHSTVETKVIDLSAPKQIEEYLGLNGFYSVPISVNHHSIKINEVHVSNVDSSYLKNFVPFKFSSKHENSFEFINSTKTSSILASVLNNLKTLKKSKNKKSILTDNSCLCNEFGISEYNSLFKNSNIAIWAHQSIDEDSSKMYFKGKFSFINSIPRSIEHENHLLKIHNDILDPKHNRSSEEHLRVIGSNLLMFQPIGGFSKPMPCNIHEITDSTHHVISPGDIPILLSPMTTDVVFTTSESIVAESLLQAYTISENRYSAYAYNFGLFAGYYNNLNGTFDDKLGNSTDYSKPIFVAQPYFCDNKCNVLVEELIYTDYVNKVSDGGFGNRLLRKL